MRVLLPLAMLALAAMTRVGAAEEVIIGHDAYHYDYQPRYYARDLRVPLAPGARVYGWTYVRPLDCGPFRYWDGTRCADARFEPPRR